MRRLIVLLALLVAACTTPVVRSDVTRFHTLGPTPAAAAFTIVPDAAQVGSLEFQDYASQLADQLSARGWRPVPPGQGGADLRVSLHWGIGPATVTTWQSPSTVYGGWGPRSPWYGGGFYDPFPYWETRTATSYPRWLAVEMSSAADSGRHVLFEGRAVADGSRPEIAPAMPYLIRALMTGFPGVSGTTVRVTIPVGP